MKNNENNDFKSLLLFIFVLIGNAVFCQSTRITGRVLDAQTKKALPFANVIVKGSSKGVTTDIDGKYSIRIDDSTANQLVFSFLGYVKKSVVFKQGVRQVINVELSENAINIQEVKIVAKGKYKNKDNPAVDLVKEIISRKDQNRVEQFDYIEFKEYEKLSMSISNISEKFKNRKYMAKYQWMFENVDSTTFKGQTLLPIYLEETLSKKYYKREGDVWRNDINGTKKVSFEDYIDNSGLSDYLNTLYNDIDIYENNILLFTNQFLSPIASTGPTFYRYYITDTLKNHEPQLVELTFKPRNSGGFLFEGILYVTLDGNYAVQGVNMSIHQNINLNWVREMRIQQNFMKTPKGKYILADSRLLADFGFSKKGLGLFGERKVVFSDYQFGKEHPEGFYHKTDSALKQYQELSDEGQEDYWAKKRPEPLSKAESKVYDNIDSLQQMPSFKRTMNLLTLVLAGYYSFDWWEIGPVNTFYNFNPIEGFRLRVGGRTTPKLDNRFYFETYAAYGFKDERWKYFLGASYSLTGRSIREFPVKSFSLSYQNDTRIPGQELQFIQEDNFLLAFKRGKNDKWTYNKIWRAEFLNEFENHFSFKIGAERLIQEGAGSITFVPQSENTTQKPIKDITSFEFITELRWAPNEQFYQGKQFRNPLPNKYPILTLRHHLGMKGILDGEYNYNRLTLNVYKRFYASQFGYTDVVFEGSRLFGQVPYPLLIIHRANQTYSYQLQSYNLMNFLEFVSDQSLSMNFDHYFNGFIFNRIPYLNRINLREVATFKILYGSLRSENNPANSDDVLLFPIDDDTETTTQEIGSKPYMEASIGIANILKFFRVDLVRRLNYLDNPNVSKYGVRMRFKLDF